MSSLVHSRARIRLPKTSDVTDLIEILNHYDSTDKYVLENYNCEYRVNARSFLGVLYMSTEFYDELFLVNLTNDGKLPFEINKYRV